jgi:hypothetical protein
MEESVSIQIITDPVGTVSSSLETKKIGTDPTHPGSETLVSEKTIMEGSEGRGLNKINKRFLTMFGLLCIFFECVISGL